MVKTSRFGCFATAGALAAVGPLQACAHSLFNPSNGETMSTNYQDLAANKDPAVRSLICPGYLIMQAAGNAGITPANINTAVRVTQLMGIFHQIMTPLFTWNPSQPGSNGAAVLDGGRTSGECKYLAAAFQTLLVSRAPYGFAVSDNDVALAEYNSKQNGFISNHVGLHYGLPSNVVDPVNQARNNLRYWGDHKVTHYLNTYWDVCYNTSYITLPDMALYVIPKTKPIANGANVEFEAVSGTQTKYFILSLGYVNDPDISMLGPYDDHPVLPNQMVQVPPKPRKVGGTCNIL